MHGKRETQKSCETSCYSFLKHHLHPSRLNNGADVIYAQKNLSEFPTKTKGKATLQEKELVGFFYHYYHYNFFF